MHTETIEAVSPLTVTPTGPIVLEQTASRLSALANGLILVPASLSMLVPFGLLAAGASTDPDILQGIAERPISALQLVVALAFAVLIVAVAVRRVIARLHRGSRIEIDAEAVRVTERRALGDRRWSVPLASFAGVSHRVRTTLSGSRHELSIVHPDAGKSLLIEIAPRISTQRVRDVATLLRLPVIADEAPETASFVATAAPALAA